MLKKANKEKWNFQDISKAFEDPSFYDHRVESIQKKETHISAVFLTGERVYKLKKPVNFGFLNYETLELRKFYCHQEVKLNQRLSSGVYLGVTSVCSKDKTLYLGTCELPLEYVVVMKQLPDDTNFQFLLERNKVSKGDIERIVSHLTDFYNSATVYNPLQTIYGDVEYVRFNAYENVQQLMPFADKIGGEETLEWLKSAVHRFTLCHRKLFAERIMNGFIKNGHGDLRAEHIYLYDGIQVLDCIEFNDRLRYGDVAVDLAFLVMDLSRLGFEDVAYQIVGGYCELSGDYQIWGMLDFYIAYRALVRAKVACLETLGIPQDSSKASELFQMANKFMKYGVCHTLAYSVPTVVVFMGLPASGKSAHGKRVAKALHAEYISSDLIRKEIIPDAKISPFGKGLYSEEHKNRVYETLISRCRKAIMGRRSVIVDATFSNSRWRKKLLDELSDLRCYVVFVETITDVDTLKERLRRREKKKGVVSDARLEHLEGFLKNYNPPDELPEKMLVRINTEGDPIVNTGRLMQSIYRKRIGMAKECEE